MQITVGLPFFNAERTLSRAIRSIFSQSHTDWKLILVDDGSIDNSLSVASSIKDSRVTVLSDGRNLGLAARLNQLAELATTDLLARMDADDMMHPDRLQIQLEYLLQHKRTDLVDTGMYSVDANGFPVGIRKQASDTTSGHAVLGNRLLSHATILGWTKWFRENPYDVTLQRCQDHELWCRTWPKSTFAKIPQPLYYCEEHGGLRIVNYLRSCSVDRDIYRRYGPGIIGLAGTRRLVAESYVKAASMAILGFLKAEGYAVRHRNSPLTSDESAAALQGIRRIAAADVVGLPAEGSSGIWTHPPVSGG